MPIRAYPEQILSVPTEETKEIPVVRYAVEDRTPLLIFGMTALVAIVAIVMLSRRG